MAEVTAVQIKLIGEMQTCAVSNAIEGLNVRSRTEGFMTPDIKSMFPGMGAMAGHAVTAVIKASTPPSENMNFSRVTWVDEILKIPAPRVIVMKDLDHPNVIGSFWGEVQSAIHTALDCVGVVTDGGVRDLDEMQEYGFNAFATTQLVSRANVHLVEANIPVTIGGVTVSPGDILLGDKHGVISIPKEVVEDLPAAIAKVEAGEKEIIDVCKSGDFSPKRLKDILRQRYGG
ncbi:MAG: RraA family protein [SAR202 cluster bacterium]|jgi:regulator of RNase E activity RraA|nr:RraA family protein [SAR202 cluster bacterium]|tara:strand:+ start:74 stop:766 length:693 start_codon:yes stop_codon:yes gene_type:complete